MPAVLQLSQACRVCCAHSLLSSSLLQLPWGSVCPPGALLQPTKPRDPCLSCENPIKAKRVVVTFVL